MNPQGAVADPIGTCGKVCERQLTDARSMPAASESRFAFMGIAAKISADVSAQHLLDRVKFADVGSAPTRWLQIRRHRQNGAQHPIAHFKFAMLTRTRVDVGDWAVATWAEESRQ